MANDGMGRALGNRLTKKITIHSVFPLHKLSDLAQSFLHKLQITDYGVTCVTQACYKRIILPASREILETSGLFSFASSHRGATVRAWRFGCMPRWRLQ